MRPLDGGMTFRKQLIDMLTAEPRSASAIARELGLKRGDLEDDLRHLVRSARAAGCQVIVEPARCRACGFTFGEDRLTRPGKCPACLASRIYEPQISVVPPGR